MFNGSFKVVINKQRISYKGISSLYIRVKINGQKKELPLHIRWQASHFDNENGLCRQRFTDDHEADDNNLIIRTEIGKVNELFKHYRINDIEANMARFLIDYSHNIPKKDFISYMEVRIKARMKDKEIIYPTYINHMKAVKKLRDAYKEVAFNTFDERWAKSFDNYLNRNMASRLTDNQNARWSIHKVIKTYIRLAKRDGIRFQNPYDYFRIRPGKGTWKAIFQRDLKKLYKYYITPNITTTHKKVLRAFLFSCMTGLRISDLGRLTKEWVDKDLLQFIPYKGRKKNKIQEVPLNSLARNLYSDALADHRPGDRLFHDVEEQYANRVLKEIGEKCEIKTPLHHHVGRHTFITLFYDKTKDLVTAMAFAGHENISATMIYTHSDRKEAKTKMKAMDDIVK